MKTETSIEFFPGSVKKAMKTAGAGSSDLWKVPVSMLKRDPNFNVRVNSEKFKDRVRTLANSIKTNGYYQDKPIAGYAAKEGEEDVIIITDGHTRFAAVELAISEGAEIEFLPVVTKPHGTSMEDLTVALVTGNDGVPLAPYEIALVCKRLIGYGMDKAEIAKRLGFTPAYVENLLTLMAAPSEIRKLVEADKVSATLAVATVREHGPKAVEVLKTSLDQAHVNGKDRITPKQMKTKSGTPALPKVSKPILVRSFEYLKKQSLDSDERFINFLAFLAGVDSPDDIRVLIADADEKKAKLEEKAQQKAQKKEKPISRPKAGKTGKTGKSVQGSLLA